MPPDADPPVDGCGKDKALVIIRVIPEQLDASRCMGQDILHRL